MQLTIYLINVVRIMKDYQIAHLIKSEDLNHHGTLFAGRSAEQLMLTDF